MYTSFSLRSGLLLLCIYLVLPCPAIAQGTCPPLKIIDFPKGDLAPASFNPGKLKKNTSYSFYYGIGVPVDYKIARYLAFAEMANNTDNQPFTGADVLLMLYANGYGVRRNLPFALRLACGNVEGAPAEVEGRKAHLENMLAGDTAKEFDFCDDITSGYMMGYCRSIQSEIMGVEQVESIKKLQKAWTAKELTAYKPLRKAATDYFNARVNNEVDMSGTARAAIGLEESDQLEDEFLFHIELISQKKTYNYDSDSLKKADAELNVIYKKVIASDAFPLGTITKEGIKVTERLWIKYRDAWVAFMKVKCPKTQPYTMQAKLTIERVDQLKEFGD